MILEWVKVVRHVRATTRPKPLQGMVGATVAASSASTIVCLSFAEVPRSGVHDPLCLIVRAGPCWSLRVAFLGLVASCRGLKRGRRRTPGVSCLTEARASCLSHRLRLSNIGIQNRRRCGSQPSTESKAA